MRRAQTLNTILAWLLASVIVPLLLGALVLLYVQALQERRAANTQLTSLATTLVEAVEREFDVSREQLYVLADSPLMEAKDWRRLHQFAAKVAAHKPGSVIGLVGPDGQQVFNTVTEYGSPQPNLWQIGQGQKEVTWEGRTLPLSSGLLTKEVFTKGVAAYSDLYYGAFIRKPALAVSVPVKSGEVTQYALVLSFPPERLQQLVDAAVAAPGLRAAVIDRRGLVIASNSAAASRLGDKVTPLVPAPASNPSTYQGVSRDGTSVTGSYAVSQKNGFAVRVSRQADGVLAFLRSATAGWLLLVLGALFASVYMASRLARRIASPLKALGLAASKGEAPHLTPTNIQEIDVLASALHAAAQSEQARRDALVRDAQRAEAEAALRRADRQKDEFLATLAHELRNPLAPIRNATELIRRASPADERVQRSREIIERQVGHMSRLVDDLLDVSRITLGAVPLKIETLDLVNVTRAAVDAVKPLATAAGLTVTQHYDAESPILISGDALRLSQCISNVLNNALKFTPAPGKIHVVVARNGSAGEVTVTDTGTGISAVNLQRIFELFVQEQPAGFRGNSGLGIGLALTDKLVKLHGGSVEAMSDGSGKGSTFRIVLPLGGSANEAASQPPAAAGPAHGAGIRVLVVDDNIDAADTLSEMLTLFGYTATAAYSGEAAKRALEQTSAKVVLLDIGLPDGSGYDLIGDLRRISPKVLVVALTGWGQESDRQKSRECGFDAHITKPAEPAAVAKVLGELAQAPSN